MGYRPIRTPYPIPHASHTRPREGSKKSQAEEHHLHLITQVNFGSRDGRGSTKSGVSTLGYGVWGIDRSGPRTPYPIPHASHTRSREGSKKSQAEKILQCMPSERNSGSSRWESSDQVGCVGLGVWGMGYDRHRPHPTSRRLAEGRRPSPQEKDSRPIDWARQREHNVSPVTTANETSPPFQPLSRCAAPPACPSLAMCRLSPRSR